MVQLKVEVIPYFDDNYSYLIYFDADGPKALVDCGDAGPVFNFLDKMEWSLDFVLTTHSHYDHAADIPSLKKRFPGLKVVKPKGEARIPTPGIEVSDQDSIQFGEGEIRVMGVPAHTNFCVSYLVAGCVFVGDALFSAGCGRLFEGQAEDLESAMDKLASLPDDTLVYFGHEYTSANLRFAQSIEPSNKDIAAYIKQVEFNVAAGEYSTPSSIYLEKKVNPFFRIDQESVVQAIDPNRALSRTKRMAALRRYKDNF
jgi:hydroxyacylglutathione hydrolase